MINRNDLKRIKEDNPELYESIYFNIAVLLQKYSKKGYEYIKEYLASNMQDKEKNNEIKKIIYKLYLSSLSKNDRKELNLLNSNIDILLNDLSFYTLFKFSETGAYNIPPMQNNINIIRNADKVILRDTIGFYSPIETIQKMINKTSDEYEALNSYLINKERIMNGERKNESQKLSRKDVILCANYLGYGKIREDKLKKQSREKNKVKTKGIK